MPSMQNVFYLLKGLWIVGMVYGIAFFLGNGATTQMGISDTHLAETYILNAILGLALELAIVLILYGSFHLGKALSIKK